MTTEKGASLIPNTRLQFQTHIYRFKHTFTVSKHTFTVSNTHLQFQTHIYSFKHTFAILEDDINPILKPDLWFLVPDPERPLLKTIHLNPLGVAPPPLTTL